MLLFFLLPLLAFAQDTVQIRSTLDSAEQPALVYLPPAQDKPVPLLVHLHSWSATYDKSSKIEEAIEESRKRNWAFISPNFRGPNDHPEACASELAIQDILDAVEYVKGKTKIDGNRIYVMGGSGGGYMTLVMAARAPQLWAAASAWVPISDLPAWYDFSKLKDARYWKMMDGCFGGPPTNGMATQQYRRRSPIHFLQLAREVPLDINTGIHDGHTGSVPVSHTLRAFNVLAAPTARIGDKDIDSITATEKIPAALAYKGADEKDRKNKILLRRESNNARVTIFEGGHETDFTIAMRWLETHTLKPRAAPSAFRGDVYILAGQSNMVGRAPLADANAPDPRIQTFDPADFWTMAKDPLHESKINEGPVGTGLGIPFAKEMVRRTGKPVGLIPCAIGGTSLEQWNPVHAKTQFRRSLYGNCIARAKLAGGNLKAILWYQGEADAGQMETAKTYSERFKSLIANFRKDLDHPDLPIYYAQLSRVIGVQSRDGWNTVQEAQREFEKTNPNTGMVATIDATLTDSIHLDAASLATVGRRFATRILDGPGPALQSATWDSPTVIRLKFTRRLKPQGDRIFGFDMNVPALFAAKIEPKSGDILLRVAIPKDASAPLELYYGRGTNPVCNLVDDRGMALPVFGPILLGSNQK